MEIRDILHPCNILTKLEADSKNDALAKMCALLKKNGYIDDAEAFLSDVLHRESMGPTGIGHGIAIPHGQSANVLKSAIAVSKLSAGIVWETHEGSGRVSVVILFVVQDDKNFSKTHLRLLADVARKLAQQEVVDALLEADTPNLVIQSLT